MLDGNSISITIPTAEDKTDINDDNIFNDTIVSNITNGIGFYRKIDSDNLKTTFYLYLINIEDSLKFNNLGLFCSNGD